MSILLLFVILEVISIAIYAILYLFDKMQIVIPKCNEDKVFVLGVMAFVGGWVLAPFFIYLAIKA